MDIVKILYREAPEAWRRALIVAGIAGIANAAILGIINRGAAMASSDTGLLGFRLLMLFGLCMIAFYVGKRYALIQASVIVEHTVRHRLDRVADKIRQSELDVVERLGRGDLFTKLSQNTSLVSQSGLILVNAAQQSFVLVFCLCYIFWLSRFAFVATVSTISVGIFIYMRHARSSEPVLWRLSRSEAELVDSLGHLVDGFKEIRLNRKKSDAAFDQFTGVSQVVRDLKIDAQINFCVDIMFSDLFFYTLLAIVVFVLPKLSPTYASVVLMTTAAILFIIGPLQMVVQAAPVFERAKAALGNLNELEERLDHALVTPMTAGGDAPAAELFKDFRRIIVDGACFSYPARDADAAGFSVGPIELDLRRGETVFIVGGNGSGKTTLLKMLTGLYLPQRGGIRVDHALLQRQNITAYRELFSTVFSDFHLFDRLYGLEDIDEVRVRAVLADLELADKTGYENGRFTDLNLSTGQRKRLALAVCLLEDKPILVFDEWAADQDPHFRQRFYQEFLPALKARGKTIIAATHDDRYWHAADRVIRLEYGALTNEQPNG